MASPGAKYLDGLNEAQKQAVLHKDGPLLIVAGAGAGKTKTITHRIAHLIESGVPARSVLAVTFTNKAAGEMRERVGRLLPARLGGLPLVTTFHSLGVRLLREFHKEAGVPRGFSIWDQDDSTRAVRAILKQLGTEEWTPRQILSAISREKGRGMAMRDYRERAGNRREQMVALVWERYEKTLAEENSLDFDDLLVRALTLLRESPKTLSLLQNRWRYLTIDEYQDTNTTQYEIARLLAGERKNICAVGDIDQLIYQWRGADMANLLSFEKNFLNSTVILLEQNYRSTRTILAAANSVIEKNSNRIPKTLFSEGKTGEPIAIYGAMDERGEAWFVVEQSALLINKGVSAHEIAVLYRENSQSRVLEEAFLHAGLPYRVLGTRFFERKEVKDVLSYLRAVLNPKSKNDIMRIVGVPPRGIGKVTLEKMLAGESLGAAGAKVAKFQESLAKIREAVNILPASEAVKFCIEESGIQKCMQIRRRRAANGLAMCANLRTSPRSTKTTSHPRELNDFWKKPRYRASKTNLISPKKKEEFLL